MGTELAAAGRRHPPAALERAGPAAGPGARLDGPLATSRGAGADILTANTFRTHAPVAREGGRGGATPRSSRRRPSRLAHRAGRGPAARDLRGGLAVAARGLLPAGPGAGRRGARSASTARRRGCSRRPGWTSSSPRPTTRFARPTAALRAAKATGVPVVVSLVTDGAGRLFSGEPIEEAAARRSRCRRSASASTACRPPRLYGELARLARGRAADVPLAGVREPRPPGGRKGWSFSDELRRRHMPGGARWVALGARSSAAAAARRRHTRALGGCIAGLSEPSA